jgi:antirestriction protein ArdC
MKMYGKATEVIEKVLENFESGKVVDAISKTVITPGDYPAKKWSETNRFVAMLQTGDADCRGYRQWAEVSRHVKTGERAAYILIPIFAKREKEDEKENEKKEEEKSSLVPIGFKSAAVFGLCQTEGRPLYQTPTSKNLPVLSDVAKKLGIKIEYSGFDGYYGSYFLDDDKITLCTYHESTFLHELCHAAHQRTCGKLSGGQHAGQEIVAEFSAIILAKFYGRKTEHVGNSFEYLKCYADKLGKSVNQAVFSFLTDIVKVLDFIIGQKESIDHSQVAKAA